MWAAQLLRSYGTKVVATATVKGVKGKRLIPTRAALTLVSLSLCIVYPYRICSGSPLLTVFWHNSKNMKVEKYVKCFSQRM